MKVNEKSTAFWKTPSVFTTSIATILFSGMTAFAQTVDTPATATQTTIAKTAQVNSQPLVTEYKSVKIGMTADEVRDRLGKAEIDDKDGFYYRFSDEEFAQIRLDEDNKVRLISVTYSGENAPKPADVFGAEVTVEAKPDGSIYKLVRYPEAGCWVAYSRTAGEKLTITVTIQKMRTLHAMLENTIDDQI